MCALSIDLVEGEQVLFQTERAVLTSQRLLANLDRRRAGEITDSAPLSDISRYEKTNGGQDTRMRPGLNMLGIGAVLTVVQLFLPRGIPYWLESVIFMVGGLALAIGAYLILSSVIRVKPNTTILFIVEDSRDIPVYFPGRDNPDADEMTRLFVRARRGF